MTRCGAFIRVSTEKQNSDERKKSLQVQKSQLTKACKDLKFEPDFYGGVEHATPGWEKAQLETMINDAKDGKIQAVMFADATRFSRDNLRAEIHIQTLSQHNIRFFILHNEVDLFDPNQTVTLGIQVRLGQWHAEILAKKSLLSKIRNAKEGVPSLGKLPFGRVWEEETKKWGIDKAKKARVQEIADVYLSTNLGWNTLGQKFGMNGAYLRKVLLLHSGDEWVVKFHSKRFKIDEEVAIKVPPLLGKETIERIKKKNEGNRLWDRRQLKHSYLLGRLIFDGETNRALVGTATPRARYYRSFSGTPGGRYSINANSIEWRVMEEIFDTIEDDKKFRKALFQGNPISKMENDLKRRKEVLERELARAKTKMDTLVDRLSEFRGKNFPSFISSMEKKVRGVEERIAGLGSEIKQVEKDLASLPSEKEIKQGRKSVQDKWEKLRELHRRRAAEKSIEDHFLSLPFEEQRKFLVQIIGGKDGEGKRNGVYVWPGKIKNHRRLYRYEIRGLLNVTLDMSSKCHAYYSFRLHQ